MANHASARHTDEGGAASGPASEILSESLQLGKDAFGRSQIFGSPVAHGDVVVIPVGRMRGGAGGGGGSGVGPTTDGPGVAAANGIEDEAETTAGRGLGHGWGMAAQATGAYVISGDRVRYLPAVDATRLGIAGIGGAVLALFLIPRVIRAART